eukprot:scaffold520_cov271-Chaetoceros_neogracile.AAC.8
MQSLLIRLDSMHRSKYESLPPTIDCSSGLFECGVFQRHYLTDGFCGESIAEEFHSTSFLLPKNKYFEAIVSRIAFITKGFSLFSSGGVVEVEPVVAAVGSSAEVEESSS